MYKLAIKVENLSKQYRLGQVGTGTISHDLNRWWYKLRGKENPYLRVGDVNDRSKKGETEYVWALKDISFELEVGQVLGIIGRNGAGKSTLLKILSKVTAPTIGAIKAKGRISSLLEVGTGFHPELTGRENIFLNGTILGMTKIEVSKKLDEIVDFAGVERYLDTPVKRYSSGMMVRLGFAVAAHLEPEILVIDEVLAVGDAEFQSKAIGKVKEVSENKGRTVLFVSHNMGSVKKICDKAILLRNGSVSYVGETEECIEKYFSQFREIQPTSFKGTLRNIFRLKQILLNDKNIAKEPAVLEPKEDITLEFTYTFSQTIRVRAGFALFKDNMRLFTMHDVVSPKEIEVNTITKSTFYIPKYRLMPGKYQVGFGFYSENEFGEWLWSDEVFQIDILSVWDEFIDRRNFGIFNFNDSVGNRIS